MKGGTLALCFKGAVAPQVVQ